MAGGFIARRRDGKCHAFGLPGLPVSSSDDVVINSAVGRGGQTKGPDVLRVQKALNLVPKQFGGPSPNLPENSVAGQETIAAIEAFQRRHFGSADGRVDVRGRTHRKISSLQPSKIRRMESAENYLKGALHRIKAAQAALLAASAELFTGGGGIMGRRNLDLVDKHFDVTKSKNPSTVLGQLGSIYSSMLTFFARPGGLWGWHAFEAYPFTTEDLGYAWAGGYYLSGKYQGGERLDTIYLASGWDTLPQGDAREHLGTIIHELAHFVGPISQDLIDDYAYGWVTDPKMKALSPYKKQHNAETFENFAIDAP